MVGPQPHLIALVNCGTLASGVSQDGRMRHRQPLPHRLGIPLVRLPEWFLGREAPAPEVPPHRPHG